MEIQIPDRPLPSRIHAGKFHPRGGPFERRNYVTSKEPSSKAKTTADLTAFDFKWAELFILIFVVSIEISSIFADQDVRDRPDILYKLLRSPALNLIKRNNV